VKELQHTSKLLIDLSADYRFDKTWTYGLPERRGERDKILGAKLVSNPGCYATGAQIALMPLADMGVLKTAQIFGVSGYSGAGTNPSDKNDLKYLTDNIVRVFFHLSVVSLKLKTPTPTIGTLRSRESHSRT
jgi:N-acetyl-gamma-glutamyl-phosphate reductase/acetylglutamate kinase